MKRTDADVVVVGSGVAGLTTALGLAHTRRVVLLTAGPLGGGSTPWAQGGLAAAYTDDDSAALHAHDTETAAAGLADPATVRRVVEEGPLRIAELVAAGAQLDRDEAGRYLLGREGGHSRHRVLHAGGDASGAEVSRALVAAVRRSAVQVVDSARAEDLLIAAGAHGRAVSGVRVSDATGSYDVTARAVVLATGGVGGLFRHSTNPADVTGVGLGLALRAGALLTDVEFVQFHPTALRVDAQQHRLPLVTEALRGAGAVLVDGAGERLMLGVHPLADLAPRDVVARRLHVAIAGGADVFLDARHVGTERLRTGFPTVVAACRAAGIDPADQPIPIAPAQHFLCGGIRTDGWGATDLPGLYAVGEVAATGLHGANRLASNSLVEGLVYGSRVAARLTLDLPASSTGNAVEPLPTPAVAGDAIHAIRDVVSDAAGIVRTDEGLSAGIERLRGIDTGADATAGDQWLVANALLHAARHRTESRGCHFRADHPATSSAWRRRVAVQLDADGSVTVADVTPELRSA